MQSGHVETFLLLFPSAASTLSRTALATRCARSLRVLSVKSSERSTTWIQTGPKKADKLWALFAVGVATEHKTNTRIDHIPNRGCLRGPIVRSFLCSLPQSVSGP